MSPSPTREWKPSEIYPDYPREKVLSEVERQGFHIVDLRRPKVGEVYLSDLLNPIRISSERGGPSSFAGGFRFILERL